MEDDMGRELTRQHIANVHDKIEVFVAAIRDRAEKHDQSKLEEPEVSTFHVYGEKLKNSTYGSDEYKDFLVGMKEALDHHYAHNRHHPEHHKNGFSDMNLVDVVELFCDWLAATERHADGDIYKSIELNTGRFKMSDQLADIFRATAKDIYGKKMDMFKA